MVGNKAQKAVAAALTGMMVLGSAAPAFAATDWERLDGTVKVTLDLNGIKKSYDWVGEDRYDTMFDAVSYNELNGDWGATRQQELWVLADDVTISDSDFKVAAGTIIDADLYIPASEELNGAKVANPKAIVAKEYKVTDEILVDNDGNGIKLKFETTDKDGKPTIVSADIAEWLISKDAANEAKLKAVSYVAESDVYVENGKNVTIAKKGEKFDAEAKKFFEDNYRDLAQKPINWEDKTIVNTFKVVDSVVLVSGQNFPDALSASALAGVMNDAPIITTKGGELSVEAKELLKYFSLKLAGQTGGKLNVFIVGGTAAVDSSIEDTIRFDKTIKANPIRIAGADRVATSLKVAKYLVETEGLIDADVIIANGGTYADALSASSFAYTNHLPILLTDSEGKLSDDEVKFLADNAGKFNEVWLVGGKNAVSAAVFDQLSGTKLELQRIDGANRYQTSANVADTFGYANYNSITVATGKNFPDALVGGAFAGAQKGQLVLVGEPGDEDFDAAIMAVAKAKKNKGFTAFDRFILGGKSAVSEKMEDYLDTLI